MKTRHHKLIPVQKIRFAEDTDGFFEYELQNRRTTLYWKKFGKQEAPTEGTRAADRSTCVLKRT